MDKVEAGKDSIFLVKYTLKTEPDNFFSFYAHSYENKDEHIHFDKPIISGTVYVGNSVKKYEQIIKVHAINQKLATIFIYKLKKPEWVDVKIDELEIEEQLHSDYSEDDPLSALIPSLVG